mmetsp:Transcript_105957/g.297929  ORF Transcript_105957/g.297929 Transcript_105957/m.297929 type:complete len:256 (+) Transcript_105957:1281-2048(+)
MVLMPARTSLTLQGSLGLSRNLQRSWRPLTLSRTSFVNLSRCCQSPSFTRCLCFWSSCLACKRTPTLWNWDVMITSKSRSNSLEASVASVTVVETAAAIAVGAGAAYPGASSLSVRAVLWINTAYSQKRSATPMQSCIIRLQKMKKFSNESAVRAAVMPSASPCWRAGATCPPEGANGVSVSPVATTATAPARSSCGCGEGCRGGVGVFSATGALPSSRGETAAFVCTAGVPRSVGSSAGASLCPCDNSSNDARA